MLNRHIKHLSIVSVGLVLVFLVPSTLYAKRLLPRLSTNQTTSSRSSQNITISVSFREDRNAVIMTLSDLSEAQSITYQFGYETNGIRQGTDGTITDMSDDPTTRELIFGSCSASSCRYDTNITNARLIVTTTFKDGTRTVKPFKIIK